jgi:hypothetical protein
MSKRLQARSEFVPYLVDRGVAGNLKGKLHEGGVDTRDVGAVGTFAMGARHNRPLELALDDALKDRFALEVVKQILGKLAHILDGGKSIAHNRASSERSAHASSSCAPLFPPYPHKIWRSED